MKVYRSRKKQPIRFRRMAAALTVLLICCTAAFGTAEVVRGEAGVTPLSQGGGHPFSHKKAQDAENSAAQPHLYPGRRYTAASAGRAEGPAAQKTAATENAGFSDAVFIGDSRTQALQTYGVLKGATYYAARGLMVNTAFTRPVIADGKGGQISVTEALKGKQFGRVYLMLGVNELGWSSTQAFIDKYGELIDTIKAIQPGAAIYVQSILPVSAKKSAEDTIYNNPNINSYNKSIQNLAKDKGVHYLPVNQAVMDASGALPADASSDGVHPNKEYCKKWAAYLEENQGDQ